MQVYNLTIGAVIMLVATLATHAVAEQCKCSMKNGVINCSNPSNVCGGDDTGSSATFIGTCSVQQPDGNTAVALGFQSRCCCIDGVQPDANGIYLGKTAQNDQHQFGEDGVSKNGDGLCQRSPNSWDCVARGASSGECFSQSLFWCGAQMDNGVITGDPHFVGFDGTEYDFHGYHNATFNIISHPSLQVNAHFDDFGQENMTFIKYIAVQYGPKDQVLIKSRPYVQDGAWKAAMEIELDGQSVDISEYTNGTVISLKSVHGMAIKYRVDSESNYAIKVTTPVMDIVSTLWHTNLHLDISAHLKLDMENIHGVLGQTYEWAKKELHQRVVEGVDEDYEVSHLWSNQFSFNRFNGESFVENELPGRVMITMPYFRAIVGDRASAHRLEDLLASEF